MRYQRPLIKLLALIFVLGCVLEPSAAFARRRLRSQGDCNKQLDLILVLDRSGSIGPNELKTLKDASNAFITALAPSANGVHVGQTSFASTGTLDLHLTGNEASAHAAVNALVSGGATDLTAGIVLAINEFDDTNTTYERPEVKDIMVIITDGAPIDQSSSAAAANDARAAGIEVFAVGVNVTNATQNFLMTLIADDAAHYFPANNFDDLKKILEDLAACPKDDTNPTVEVEAYLAPIIAFIMDDEPVPVLFNVCKYDGDCGYYSDEGKIFKPDTSPLNMKCLNNLCFATCETKADCPAVAPNCLGEGAAFITKYCVTDKQLNDFSDAIFGIQ